MSDKSQQPLSQRIKQALDGDMIHVRDQARAFISRDSMKPVSPDTPKEIYREKTLQWVRDMVAAGYTQLPYATENGGAGKRKEYMNIVEIISHQDMSLAIKQGVQFGLFGMGLEGLGTKKHHDKYLRDLMNGKLLGGFAMTEIAGGSDVQGVSTEAVYNHATGTFTINTPNDGARKAYIGNAARHGRMMIVFAQLKMDADAPSEGVHAFLVPVRDKQGNVLNGVTIEDCGHKIGLNGVDNGYLSFNNVTVPYDAMLDRFAQIDGAGQYQSDIKSKNKRFFKMIETLVTGRVFVSMAALSGAKNALTTAVNHAENRKVFGDTLMDKQATQKRILPSLAETYALHFMTRYIMDEYQKGNEYLETMAAAIKAKSSDKAMDIVDEARLLGGGDGYMSENRYGALRADMDVFRTFEGDNTVLRLLVARNQMMRLSRKFNTNVWGKVVKSTALYLKKTFANVYAVDGDVKFDRFLDPRVQRKLFGMRERAMMYSMSSKFMKIAKATNGNNAANLCQNDMLEYADAYAERLMVQKFVKAVKAQKDPEVKALLKDVCDLYAISTMRKNGMWYVEKGYMHPKTATVLRRLERHLIEKIRPHAQTLTQAFDIPDQVLKVVPPTPKKPAKGNKPKV